MSVNLNITSDYLVKSNYAQIHAGDDYDYSFTLIDSESVAVDLTDAILWFTVKEREADLDSSALLAYISTDPTQIEINVDPETGQFVVHFKSADTVELAGLWYYDLKVKLESGSVKTLAYGRIQFLQNITRSTTIEE